MSKHLAAVCATEVRSLHGSTTRLAFGFALGHQ